MADTTKRSAEESEEKADNDEWVGPMPSEAAKPKKRKVLEYEKIYLANLPSAEAYEKSYMHRDVILHVCVTRTDFIVTASQDGHIKFWKKCEEEGIEFVKHFRAHIGVITDLSVSYNGEMCASISEDKAIKVFDVVNFDMINMMRLNYTPSHCCWIYSPGDAITALAVCDKDSPAVHIYDGRGRDESIHVAEKIHHKPVVLIRYNALYEVVVSVDNSGMLEYWTGPKNDYGFPKNIFWEYKTDTDLFEFAKCKTLPLDIAFSPNGKLFCTLAKDRKVRIFKFLTGKITKVIDESLQQFTELQQMKQQVPNMEFGRRLAVEKDLERSEALSLCNIIFDESGNFILYGTLLGVKVLNIATNQCSRVFGKTENARFLHVALFQGTAKKPKAAVTAEMKVSENPELLRTQQDPTLFCTAYKKHRFFMFTTREPDDTKSHDAERDVFNERPSKEDIAAAPEETSHVRVSNSAIIHTSLGDLHIKLFAKECPKTVENFCVHSRNGYYNGHLFHRVIKGFMIQTGDPSGNGTGGESIWGGEFEDEFHPSLRHDRPYTLSMANAGANTNGSQFFVTVVPTPWLDNKHTVFGRIVRGMEAAQNICNAKTHPKTDKPYDDITIINVTLK